MRPLRDDEFGCLYGLVDVVDCVPLSEVQGQPYAEGIWCWLLENPRPIEPVPCKGRTLLFSVPMDIAATASRQNARVYRDRQ